MVSDKGKAAIQDVSNFSTSTHAAKDEAVSHNDNMPHYKYRPLDKEKQEIRLVRIHPGQFDERIRIEIIHAPFIVPERVAETRCSLELLRQHLPPDWEVYETLEGRYIFFDMNAVATTWDHPVPELDSRFYHSPAVLDPFLDFEPSFDALSYTWGTEDATEVLDVLESADAAVPASNKITALLVRPNLVEALRHLREPDEIRVLWIDAICINQDDVSERNAEVQRMDKIYTLASRVVVWLGMPVPDEPHEHGLETLQYLGDEVECCKDGTILPSPTACEQFWFHPRIELPYSEDDCTAITNLLQRSWFDRLWIWQEIQLANHKTTMLLGNITAEWYAVRRALVCLNAKQDTNPILPRKLLQRRVALSQSHSGTHIYNIISRTRATSCLLEHDRIFAVLGLCQPGFASRIRVDYSVPIVDLFKNVCEATMELYDHLDFLAHCEGPENAIAGAPTWVPNWLRSVPIQGWPAETVCGLSGTRSARIVGSHLEVHGVEYEAVQYITDPAPANGDIASTIRRWREADLSHGRHGTSECSLDGFLKVVSVGIFSERWPLYNHPTMQEWHDFYESDALNDDEDVIKLRQKCQSKAAEPLKGRCFFRAGDLVGLCSQSVLPDDVICILLGFNWPIILRPQPDSTYQVVSTAYIPQLCDGNGLLGSLEAHWRITNHPDESGGVIPWFHNTESGEVFFEHPRLGSIPDGWTYFEGYEGSGTHNPVFFHQESGTRTWKDPRLSPEALRARGILVKTLHIV